MSRIIFLSVFILSYVLVQSQNQEATIKIEKSVNGETTIIEKKVDLQNGQDINSILEEYGVLDDLGNLKDGQSFEINVIKKDGVNIDRDIKIEYFDSPNFNFELESKAFLGVMLSNMEEEGVLITEVIEGTQAEKAGLLDGDIILSLNSEEFNSVNDLVNAISEKNAGDVISLVLLRNNEILTKTVELGEKKISPFDIQPYKFDQFPEIEENTFEFHLDENGNWASADLDEKPAFLGVSPSFECAAENEPAGVKLGKITPGSSAEEMGLLPGDIITKIQGEKVEEFDELAYIISNLKAGNEIKLTVIRNSKKLKLEGVLGSRNMINSYPGNQMFEHLELFPDMENSFENGEFFFKFDGDSDGLPLEGLNEQLEELMRSFEENGQEFNSEEFEQNIEELLSPMLENLENITEEIRICISVEPITEEDMEIVNQNAEVEINKENTLGLEYINFFPNPTNGQFNLKFSLNNEAPYRVFIYNQMGKTIFEEERSSDAAYENSIDLSNFSAGPYYLVISQNDQSYSRKIIKE